MSLKSGVGERIRELRSAHGLSQVQLARAVGISPRAMISIEKAQAATSLDILEDLARELGVSPEALLSVPKASTPIKRDLFALIPTLDDSEAEELLALAKDLLASRAPMKASEADQAELSPKAKKPHKP